MNFARLVLPLVLALSVPAVMGCSDTSGDELEEEDQALVLATGNFAERASRLAERLGKKDPDKRTAADEGKRDPSVLRLPLIEGTDGKQVLPSTVKSIGGWVVQLVAELDTDKTELNGMMLIPTGQGVPLGSFGLVLGDGANGILATAAYVPDGARDAQGWAKSLVGAIPIDAATWASPGAATDGIKTQGLKDAFITVAQVVGGIFRASDDTSVAAVAKAATVANARLAKAEGTPLWGKFRSAFWGANAAAPTAAKARILEVSQALARDRRQSVFLTSNSSASLFGRETVVDFKKLSPVVEKALAKRSALVVNTSDTASLPAVILSLENRVPVVVSGQHSRDEVMELIRSRLKRLEGTPDEVAALQARLDRALQNPESARLVHVIDTRDLVASLTEYLRRIQYINAGNGAAAASSARSEAYDVLELIPGLAMAERAIEVTLRSGYSGFNQFIRQFERLDQISLVP